MRSRQPLLNLALIATLMVWRLEPPLLGQPTLNDPPHTLEEIELLLKSSVPPGRIRQHIEFCGVTFIASPADVQRLRAAGASA